MTTFDEIKKRKDNFDKYNHPDFYEGDDSIGARTANEFWANIEDDAAWLVDEVERLHAELARFAECAESYMEQSTKFWWDCTRKIYHKE